MDDDDMSDDVFEDLADVEPPEEAPTGDNVVPPEADAPEVVPDDAEQERGQRFSDAYEFFEMFLRNTIERRVNKEGAGRGLRWDPDWRRHPEIVLRMQALWEAWEGARISKEPDAMSNWWIHHLDPHLAKMLEGTSGPMSPDHDSEAILPPLPSMTLDDSQVTQRLPAV